MPIARLKLSPSLGHVTRVITLPARRAARTVRPHFMYLAYPLLDRWYRGRAYSRLMSAGHHYAFLRRRRLSRFTYYLATLLCCAEFEARLIRRYVYPVNAALGVPPHRTALSLSGLYWRHAHPDPFATTGTVYSYLMNQQDTHKRLHPGSQDRVSLYFYDPTLRRTDHHSC